MVDDKVNNGQWWGIMNCYADHFAVRLREATDLSFGDARCAVATAARGGEGLGRCPAVPGWSLAVERWVGGLVGGLVGWISWLLSRLVSWLVSCCGNKPFLSRNDVEIWQVVVLCHENSRQHTLLLLLVEDYTSNVNTALTCSCCFCYCCRCSLFSSHGSYMLNRSHRFVCCIINVFTHLS